MALIAVVPGRSCRGARGVTSPGFCLLNARASWSCASIWMAACASRVTGRPLLLAGEASGNRVRIALDHPRYAARLLQRVERVRGRDGAGMVQARLQAHCRPGPALLCGSAARSLLPACPARSATWARPSTSDRTWRCPMAGKPRTSRSGGYPGCPLVSPVPRTAVAALQSCRIKGRNHA